MQQAVIRNDDESVDLLAQFLNTALGVHLTTTAFKGERTCHHTNGECTQATCDGRNDRSSTGSGSATFTSGNEHHVGALENFFNFFTGFFCGSAAHLGVSTCAKTLGDVATDVELDVSVTHQESLCVGVNGDELHALETDINHAVDGVNATTTDADDLDQCHVILRSCHSTRLP